MCGIAVSLKKSILPNYTSVVVVVVVVMPLPLRAEALNDDVRLTFEVCLSHTLGLSQEQ